MSIYIAHRRKKTPLMRDVGYLSSTFERYIAFHFWVNSGHETDRWTDVYNA